MIGKITSAISKLIAMIFKPQMLLIIGIIAVLYLGFFSTASFLGRAGSPVIDSTSTTLLSEDSSKVTYEFSFATDGSSDQYGCSETTGYYSQLDVPSTQPTSSLPDYPASGLKSTNAETAQVSIIGIEGIGGACSSRTSPASVQITGQKAICNIKNENGKAQIDCNVIFNANSASGSPIHIYGLPTGTITVTFEKNPVQSEIPADTIPGDTSPSFTNYNQSALGKIKSFIDSIIFRIKSIFMRFS